MWWMALDRWWEEEEGRREEWNGWIDEECVVDGLGSI
jgi:hypothetical protein